MPQERLTKIWDMLSTGSKVLGWTRHAEDGRQILIPANGRNSWERTGPDARWTETRGL